MPQRHDIGHQKRSRRGTVKEYADYSQLASSLVERGLCSVFILQGRHK
jgi:hypothetical protein